MGSIIGDEISEHSSASHKKVVEYYGFIYCQEHKCNGLVTLFIYFWTYHNFLLGLFCWEDACQQYTVQLIMEEDERRARIVIPEGKKI